jgi:hypothetical protein
MSDMKSPGPAGGESLQHRLREELRKYLIISAYLYICFGALQLYKSALLQDAGVHYAAWGVAVVKALIVGKFLLIGDAVQNRMRRHPQGLPGRIAKRIFWLLVILVLLTIAEELVVGWIHGQSIAEMRTEFHSRSMLELLAEMLVMLLILVPLVAAAELNQAQGSGGLRRLMSMRTGTAGNDADHDRPADQGPE